ncbi:YopR family T3SS polymerization control protein [Aeromonas tecta]|uniref:YopR family T3SS polymerization control protein n=1 Tax=Aeromonas tecta TaxID=324617 RepID=UPI00067FD6FF|nr:YopR family T3SS polymerization control protein [Aeromonas tecta]
MKVDSHEAAAQNVRPDVPLRPPEQTVQHQFERLLATETAPDLFARWKEGASLESLLSGAAPAAQRDLLWQIYQQDSKAPGIGERLFQPVTDKLVERFSGRQLPVVTAIDLPELRALMREFDPLASRRERVLLNVMAELKGEQGVVPAEWEFLGELARRELMVSLIPLNGIVNNLMRHSHKLDLEG